MTLVALTTIDNPYDPFDQFDQWYVFDTDKGYNSLNYLARLTNTEDYMTDQERTAEVERAIDTIVKHDFMNIYTKVKREE